MKEAADLSHAAALAFIQRWQGSTASELSTAQSFVTQLCALLGVDAPHPTADEAYMFERPVTFRHGDGSSSPGRIDCYRRGHFVLEAKKLKAGAHTKGFDDALLRARAQAEGYARALPAPEGRPPFLLVVDVGNVIELYSEFTQSGATYTPFPDPRSHRIALASLADPDVRQLLRNIWTEPLQLNPAIRSARVTREVSDQLAVLAKSLEASGHRPEHVGSFLTRALFSMFAEDVNLLDKGSFLHLLETHRAQPADLQQMLKALWADMDKGGFSTALAKTVKHFNGKLFKESNAQGYSLLLNQVQIALLIQAAKANWRDVEPAIFGTLLERALSAGERASLGAHYTPRAYVERLVMPTVIEPLRTQWLHAQAAALLLAHEASAFEAAPVRATSSLKADLDKEYKYNTDLRAKWAAARQPVEDFHQLLCTTVVLDPACGSGNFLYVTLEHLKRLEGEVLNQLAELGHTQNTLALSHETVSLKQLRGIELNPRAAAVAELVLWIGYLQWQIRTQGSSDVSEPVVHDYGNIVCQDAVLLADEANPVFEDGQLKTRWDGHSTKPHPVTGLPVPDEAAMVPELHHVRARQPAWPQADYIVGNPPFIGASTMRAALGDGYVQALRKAWPDVPESADFVMYWWHRAASLVAQGQVKRFGFITTNSLRQTFNRRVVQAAMDKGVGLVFAIADHPWVDSANGAAVRIAMTVGIRPGLNLAGQTPGRLLVVSGELTGEFGEVNVELAEKSGLIHADLSIGANVASAIALQACDNLCFEGVKPHGMGFIVTPEEATALGVGTVPGLERHIPDFRNGRDLTDISRGVKIIDMFGLTSEQVRELFPAVYQRLLEHVKPERDQNNRASRREKWWLFGETNPKLRTQLVGLTRYIATVKTAKHLLFQFLDISVLPDSKLIAICHDDAMILGVLSSSVHGAWSRAQGSTLEDRPTYVISRCFETFPFPSEDTGLSAELRTRIAALAEHIDTHRKRVLAPSAKPALALTLTGLYNVMQALNEGRALSDKEKTINAQGQVGVLKDLHDDLNAAVLAAYGWSDLDKDNLLTRLVALNAQRAAEEKTGTVRWLRPEFQNPVARNLLANKEQPVLAPIGLQADLTLEMAVKPLKPGKKKPSAKTSAVNAAADAAQAWPAALPDQVKAVAQVLASAAAALPVSAIEARFKSKGPWKKTLPRILETLEVLGRARREGAGLDEVWRA